MLTGLLWPDRIPVSDAHRAQAIVRIAEAESLGLIDANQARARQALVPAANTRGQLSTAVRDLPGATAPALLIARRLLAALWLGVSAVEIVVWALVCLIGLEFVFPFWIWTAGIGGAVVCGLWMVTEYEYKADP